MKIIVFWFQRRWSWSLRLQLMISIDSVYCLVPNRQQAINRTQNDLLYRLVPTTTITNDASAPTCSHILPKYATCGLFIVNFGLVDNLPYCEGVLIKKVNDSGLQPSLRRLICYMCTCLKSSGMHGITISWYLPRSGGYFNNHWSPRQ